MRFMRRFKSQGCPKTIMKINFTKHMKIEKLHIPQGKVDINLQFYFFLKYSVKLSPNVAKIDQIIEEYNLLHDNVSAFCEQLKSIFASKSGKHNAKLEQVEEICARFANDKDVELFIFALKLYQIKDLLLQEAKINSAANVEKLANIDPLSLEYDRISVIKPYSTRINGALLSLLFFEKLDRNELNFMSQDACDFVGSLAIAANIFREIGLESNQIFMLMFSEVVNQSIISDSGSNYESRTMSVLQKGGITNITKTHDKNDKSTEFDFFFEIGGRTFGIGAKRTLRERYKQFIKTAQSSHIDVMIEITLGLDLNEEKARIIGQHGVYLFVADEVYQTRSFLQKMDHVFSVKDLNARVLSGLKSIKT